MKWSIFRPESPGTTLLILDSPEDQVKGLCQELGLAFKPAPDHYYGFPVVPGRRELFKAIMEA